MVVELRWPNIGSHAGVIVRIAAAGTMPQVPSVPELVAAQALIVIQSRDAGCAESPIVEFHGVGVASVVVPVDIRAVGAPVSALTIVPVIRVNIAGSTVDVKDGSIQLTRAAVNTRVAVRAQTDA